MKISKLAIATFSLMLAGTAVQAAPGYGTATLKVTHREKPLPLHIWYPAKGDGTTTMLGKNAVFTGIEVQAGATPKSGKFPLVLLSHGSGGNAVNIGWIAARIAEKGAIVVSTNHPGTTSRDSLPRKTLKIWQRTEDFSAILDYFQKTAPFNLAPDMGKVGAVGFSIGGHTVLGLAGARVVKQKYLDYCNQFPKMLDCGWYKRAGVELSTIDATMFEQDNRDRRIKAVVSIDPALAQAYEVESLEGISMPVLVVNLGMAGKVPAGVNGAGIIGKITGSTYVNISEATHFSFLGRCTSIGEAIIKDEGEDPICSETGSRSRAEIHRELGDTISGFLNTNLR